jgi:hypothetical protein
MVVGVGGGFSSCSPTPLPDLTKRSLALAFTQRVDSVRCAPCYVGSFGFMSITVSTD